MHTFIELARQMKEFTIDTEHDYYTHRPALIQIEFIHQPSWILLIEINHLPDESSLLFWLIRSLFKIILNYTKIIFSWGNLKDELTEFINSKIFSSNTLYQINFINVQQKFKEWHANTMKHVSHYPLFDSHQILCTYVYKSLIDLHHKWSLQMAIAYVFNEFLDKTRTKSNWSRHLDLSNAKASSRIHNNEKQTIEEMIQYAAYDCLAVTKLAIVLELN